MIEYKFEAIGTIWNISFYEDENVDSILKEIQKIIEDFESKYSRFKENSIIYNLRNKIGEFLVGEEFIEILNLYFKYYELSDKKFTPFVGRILEDLGYDKDYSFTPKKDLNLNLPDLFSTIKVVENDKILINNPVILDFGGVGKGFLIEKVSNYLKNQNIGRFCIDGGGDINYSSGKNLIRDTFIKIGLENPISSNEIIGSIELNLNQSICSSSNNKRKWLQSGHIVNTDNAILSKKILSSWIVSNSVTKSDIIATISFLIDISKVKNSSFEYFILFDDFSYEKSNGFNADLFFAEQKKYC